eukprot:c10254_g1_i1.p2 GENE.c10254_g1_i1~~c10254_g1_i1.p2  ORF type:complete len:110 (-),score=19.74 c10254_g1_i1:384-713(-)
MSFFFCKSQKKERKGSKLSPELPHIAQATPSPSSSPPQTSATKKSSTPPAFKEPPRKLSKTEKKARDADDDFDNYSLVKATPPPLRSAIAAPEMRDPESDQHPPSVSHP